MISSHQRWWGLQPDSNHSQGSTSQKRIRTSDVEYGYYLHLLGFAIGCMEHICHASKPVDNDKRVGKQNKTQKFAVD